MIDVPVADSVDAVSEDSITDKLTSVSNSLSCVIGYPRSSQDILYVISTIRNIISTTWKKEYTSVDDHSLNLELPDSVRVRYRRLQHSLGIRHLFHEIVSNNVLSSLGKLSLLYNRIFNGHKYSNYAAVDSSLIMKPAEPHILDDIDHVYVDMLGGLLLASLIDSVLEEVDSYNIRHSRTGSYMNYDRIARRSLNIYEFLLNDVLSRCSREEKRRILVASRKLIQQMRRSVRKNAIFILPDFILFASSKFIRALNKTNFIDRESPRIDESARLLLDFLQRPSAEKITTMERLSNRIKEYVRKHLCG